MPSAAIRARFSCSVAPSPGVTISSAEQVSKEPAGRMDGSHCTVSFRRPVMPSKAPSPISFSEAGRVSSSTWTQLRNAPGPMDSVVPNRSISSTEESASASAPMWKGLLSWVTR